MNECSTCGTQLSPHEIRCPTCGKVTAQYHRQRRCVHCGTPAAAQAKSCIMCHKPVDSLSLDRSIFSGSWIGIVLGVLIIVGLVMLFNRAQQENAAQVAQAALAATANADTPTPTVTLTPTPTVTPTPLPPTDTPTLTPVPTATPRTHIVESGQSMLLIAQTYGVPLNVLFDFNRLTEDDILSVGQEIKIPPSRADSVAAPLPGNDGLPAQMVYVVQQGDTLSGIASDKGTTVDAITQANPLTDLSLIFPGQQLIVPLSTPTPTHTPTPLPTHTPTPGPDYPPPALLLPTNGQVVDQRTLLLNWTSPRLLADDEFYVVTLLWPNNVRTTHWVRSNSLRLPRDERPANGNISWSVSIRQRIGTSAQGDPLGITLSPPGETREFEWR